MAQNLLPRYSAPEAARNCQNRINEASNTSAGRGEAKAGENVIIRPMSPDAVFVQLDDLKTHEQLERVRPAAFIIHKTSPGNHQAWIAVSGVPPRKEAFSRSSRAACPK